MNEKKHLSTIFLLIVTLVVSESTPLLQIIHPRQGDTVVSQSLYTSICFNFFVACLPSGIHSCINVSVDFAGNELVMFDQEGYNFVNIEKIQYGTHLFSLLLCCLSKK